MNKPKTVKLQHLCSHDGEIPTYRVSINIPEAEIPGGLSTEEHYHFAYQPSARDLVTTIARKLNEYIEFRKKETFNTPDRQQKLFDDLLKRMYLIESYMDNLGEMPKIDDPSRTGRCTKFIGENESIVVDGKAYNRLRPSVSIDVVWVRAEPCIDDQLSEIERECGFGGG